MVPHHEGARGPRGPRHAPHPGEDHGALDRPVDHPGGRGPVQPHCRPPRLTGPVVLGHGIHDPLPRSRAAIEAGQGRRDAGFIPNLQAGPSTRATLRLQGGSEVWGAEGVAFRGREGLFFRGSLSRCTSRPSVAGLTCRPVTGPRWSLSSSRGAAGRAAPACRPAAVCARSWRGAPPARGLAASRPGGCQRGQSLSTTDRLTRKRAARSRWVSSWASRAAMTFARRARE